MDVAHKVSELASLKRIHRTDIKKIMVRASSPSCYIFVYDNISPLIKFAVLYEQ